MQTQHINPYRPLQKSYAKHLYMSFNANTKLIVRDASRLKLMFKSMQTQLSIDGLMFNR